MSKQYNENGFTLIEVLIAIVILSIALLGLSSMNLYTIKGNDFAKRGTAAVALAQDKLEALKNLSYTDAQLNDSNTGNDGSYTALQNTAIVDSQEASIDETGGAGGTYTRVTNIADSGTGANSYTNTKLIVVIVSWSDSSGSHSVTLTTMKGCKEFDAAGTCTG